MSDNMEKGRLLSLKVRLPETDTVKTIAINPGLIVYDACKIIREKSEVSKQLGKGKSVLFT